MPDCSDKTILITGANSGIGFAATRAFAGRGATVIMACRSIERGEQAANEISDSIGNTGSTLTIRQCDLASLESVESFATGIKQNYESIDILCNNAGVMAIPRQETEDGFEQQFGVNHLGHFALTGQVLNLLIENEGESRIVTHSSGAHEFGEMKFTDLQRKESYGKWKAYAQSKLANLLFTYELQRRLQQANITNTISVGCHPGYTATNLQYRGPKEEGSKLRLGLMKVVNTIFGQSARNGALSLLYAAIGPEVTGGDYYGPKGIMNMRGAPEKQSSSEASYDEADAKRLWEKSEALTGVTYEF